MYENDKLARTAAVAGFFIKTLGGYSVVDRLGCMRLERCVYGRSYENTDIQWPPPNVDEKTNNRNESISSRTGDRGGSPYTFYYCFVFTPNYNFYIILYY